MASLPSSAQARLDRFAAAHARTSLLSVPAAAGVAAAGFDAVGEVFGGTVRRLSGMQYGTCGSGLVDAGGPAVPPVLSSDRRSRYRAYAEAMRGGYSTALQRLLAEAQSLGADGVVGVRLHRSVIGEICHEFTALGTAVRARAHTRPTRPFTTDLGGADFAKLLLGGWVPSALHVGLEVALRHNDAQTVQELQRLRRGNFEVAGYAELAGVARDSARARLRKAIARSGADGGLLAQLHTRSWDTGCDHVMEVLAVGTAISRVGRGRATSPATLTVLPVRT